MTSHPNGKERVTRFVTNCDKGEGGVSSFVMSHESFWYACHTQSYHQGKVWRSIRFYSIYLTPHSFKPFFVWDYNNGDFLGLNNALYVTPCEFIIMNSRNVNSALSNITNVINQTLKAFISTKVAYPYNKSKPWLTRELRLLLRKRSRYYKRWLKTKNI